MKTLCLSLLLIVTLAVPLQAFIGPAWLQRAIMIINQGLDRIEQKIQTVNSSTQVVQLTTQIAELRSQIQHMRDSTVGRIQPIQKSFSQLVARPTSLVLDTMQFQQEFTGTARAVLSITRDLATARAFRESWRDMVNQYGINEDDLQYLLAELPPDVAARILSNFREEEEAANTTLALNHTLSEAASALSQSAKAAHQSLENLRSNTNVSNTALGQAQVTALATQGEVLTAMAQLQALAAANQASDAYEQEIQRRRDWEKWRQNQTATNTAYTSYSLAVSGNVDNLRQGLIYNPPSFFTDSSQ